MQKRGNVLNTKAYRDDVGLHILQATAKYVEEKIKFDLPQINNQLENIMYNAENNRLLNFANTTKAVITTLNEHLQNISKAKSPLDVNYMMSDIEYIFTFGFKDYEKIIKKTKQKNESKDIKLYLNILIKLNYLYNEYSENIRKKTNNPKEIVDYLCRKSISDILIDYENQQKFKQYDVPNDLVPFVAIYLSNSTVDDLIYVLKHTNTKSFKPKEMILYQKLYQEVQNMKIIQLILDIYWI